MVIYSQGWSVVGCVTDITTAWLESCDVKQSWLVQEIHAGNVGAAGQACKRTGKGKIRQASEARGRARAAFRLLQ